MKPYEEVSEKSEETFHKIKEVKKKYTKEAPHGRVKGSLKETMEKEIEALKDQWWSDVKHLFSK